VAVALGRAISLQEAQFWMNVGLELLAIDHHALRRMRRHLAAHPGRRGEIDVKLLVMEVDRVMNRLKHWEEVVDKVRSGRR
jgi:thermostable 8-oxoguanine DNA glycosylase